MLDPGVTAVGRGAKALGRGSKAVAPVFKAYTLDCWYWSYS